MRELAGLLTLLKVGVSKDSFPVYAQHLKSDGSKVHVCNNEVYMSLECRLPFTGVVNFFSLSNILSKIGEQDFNVAVEDNQIKITSNHSSYTVSILDLGLPVKEEPDGVEVVDVDDEILTDLKTAHKFCGKGLYQYIYLYSNGIIATSGSRLFSKAIDFGIGKPIAINAKILSTLYPGCSVGTDENNNTVVFYPIGFAVFTVDNINYYPAEKIKSFIDSLPTEPSVLCNVLSFKDWVESVVPIFGADRQNFVEISNAEGVGVVVSGESAVSGNAQVKPEIICTKEFKILLDANYVKDIPSDFDVMVNDGSLDKLVLANGDGATIVLMGARS